MSHRTCSFNDCETPLVRKSTRGRWPKYCEDHKVAAKKQRSKANGPDSKTKICVEGGCDRPVRARGVCDMHYKRQARAEGRWNEKKLVACVVCDTEVERVGGGGRKYGNVCSTICRELLNGGPAERCRIPDDHWVRWIGKTSAWPRGGWKKCAWCDDQFAVTSAGKLYCSELCRAEKRRDSERTKNGWVAADLTASLDRYCERCGKEYRSPYLSRVHCSDFCRDADADNRRKSRGTALYHGWISKFDRLKIYERDNHVCWLCNEPVDRDADPQKDDWAPSLDHVVPRSRGGSHDPENLRTAHRWCNAVRSDNDYHELFDEVLV